MKKLLSLLLMLALVLPCVAAGADYATANVVDTTAARNISVHPAGENEVPAGYSPTTGRYLPELAEEAIDNGFLGMSVTGVYSPIMVQHCGYAGDVRVGAPWYGSYADVFYMLPKSYAGHVRMAMIFNDFHPVYVGGSRSTRVGYLWIRQEWNAPYFYAGYQADSWTTVRDTNVLHEIEKLKLPNSADDSVPAEKKVIFNGLEGKAWSVADARYRVDAPGYVSGCNFVWNLHYELENILGDLKLRDYPNHAFKFADEPPAGGDNAEFVYVMYDKRKAVDKDNENDPNTWYYFNTMFEYDEDEGAYVCYKIANLDNPQLDAVPFTEQVIDEGQVWIDEKGGSHLKCSPYAGNDITFANVVVQTVEEHFNVTGGECPYPTLKGQGNADYFIGGKHYSGVWKKDGEYIDGNRTVFYGEDGEEITFMPGRTMIIVFDPATTVSQKLVRELRYE